MRRLAVAAMSVVLWTVAVVLLLAALFWWGQERLVFQPPGRQLLEAWPAEPVGPGLARIDYTALDGQPLFAWLVGERERPRTLVIAFHGNAEIAAWEIPWAREVARRTGALVLLPEYRGYAGLPGTPTCAGTRLDARAAYALARDQLGFAPERIVLFGYSLGSAIATELAVTARPRALVLQAPFTSARDMARGVIMAPLVPVWRLVSRVPYDTERDVRSLETPVWVVHGRRDRIVPFSMGERVFAAARRPGELLAVANGGHADVVAAGGEAYWAWLGRALAD